MTWNHDMMGWWGGYGMIFFWVLLIVVIIFLVKYLMPGTDTQEKHKESPLEILKRRYAKGEIDKAEYEEKRKDLET